MQNPPILYTMPGTTQTGWLPQNLWHYFCHEADAYFILRKVSEVVQNAKVTADQFLTIQSVRSLDPDIKVWRIVGTYNGLEINEYAADLYDRLSVPAQGVDINPDTSMGGDRIFVEITGNYAQLAWHKHPSTPLAS